MDRIHDAKAYVDKETRVDVFGSGYRRGPFALTPVEIPADLIEQEAEVDPVPV